MDCMGKIRSDLKISKNNKVRLFNINVDIFGFEQKYRRNLIYLFIICLIMSDFRLSFFYEEF